MNWIHIFNFIYYRNEVEEFYEKITPEDVMRKMSLIRDSKIIFKSNLICYSIIFYRKVIYIISFISNS